MFKKIFITLLILIVLALGGLSYYVSTIDWNNYKTKMTAQLEKMTGKKIVINGKIDLTFWPKPHLSATNIKVYNSNPNPAVANTPIAEVKEMVADLSLMPLIKKQFVIDKMNLVNANLLIEFLDDGKTNWYSPIDAEQSFNLAGVDIAFNSVMLQDSVVRIVNKTLNVDSAFHKVNADISAQSLIGPFRIDGNFLKDNTPAGFALNVGTLSESFSTSLNLVLTHPSSESYARFDGSVLSNNSEIKGNFTVESQKPSVFVNTITGQKLLDEKYNYPVAASIDLSVNPRQADLSSFIVKYGDNLAGSGRVLVPLVSTNDEPKKIEAVFEMTDLDLMPFVSVLQEYLKQAEATKKPYEPEFSYDVAADIAATRALLGGETIRNFKLSADIVKGVIKIKNLAALTAGDTDISVKGDIFENDKRLMYNFQVQALSQDLLKFLHWANVNVEAYTPSTYRSARASFNLSGTLSEIKIAPVELGFDKVEMSGVIGIKRDRKNAIFLNLQSENINFDNYLPEPKKDADKETFTTRAKQFLSQFKFLNTTDLEANLSLSLGIYHKIPFENTTLKLSARDGVVTLKEMSIANVASSKLSATGVLSKLNGNPSFENLKYKFDISDFKTFNQKLKLGLPDWPLFHQTQKATLEGIASGTFDAFNTKTIAQVGKTAVSYAGRLSNNDGQLFYRGKLKLKAPDFVEFANQIGLDYNPRRPVNSIMTFDADVEGETKDWHADNIDTFIGTNHMTGSFKYTKKFNKPMITAHMEANLFEFDRFVFAPLKTPSGRQNKTTATFLEQPRFDKTKIDYSPLQKFDLFGYFKIKNLSYLNWDIENVTFFLDIKNDKITVKDFVGDKKPTTYQTTFSIYISDAPRVEGNLTVKDADMGRMGGSVYGFERGKMAFQTKYQGAASSVEDLMQTLKATTEIKLNDVVFKGLSIQPIVENLKTRTHSDGLHAFLEKKLSSGETAFETAKATLDIDEGRFTISNAAMQNGDVTLNISGTGSLDTWKADIKNIISAETLPTDLPKVEFDFSGSMSNPVLKIDDEDIIAHYDTHWRELEEQEKARKEAEEKALKDRMDQAQAIVTKQISFLNTEVFPRIERYKPFGADAAFVKIYESADIESNDILKTLKQLASKAYRTYNDEDIDKINIQTSVFAPTLPELVDRLDATYFEDLKQHIRNEAKGIEAIYNNSQEKSVNYQNTLNSYTMRLMQIGSLVVLDHLDEVKTNKAKVVDALRNIADTYRQSTALLKTTDTLNSIAQLDAQYQKIKTLRQNAQENFEALNTALENMFIYIQDVVYFEQTGKHKTPQPVAKVEENTAEESESEPQEEIPENKAEPEPQEVSVSPVETAPEIEVVVKPASQDQDISVEVKEDRAPQVNEPVVEVTVDKQSDMEAIPTKFSVSTEQVSEPAIEDVVVIETPEPIDEDIKIVEEVVPVVVEQKPLLIEATDDYMSKINMSGTVSRKSASTSTNNTSQTPKKSLLKPIEGEVLIEGVVKRK